MNLHRLYFTLFPQDVTITPRAHGLDVSKYDQYFLPNEATAQLDFVIQRVSYGITRDEAFAKLVGGVMQVGIHGCYHYLSSYINWQEQADKFLSYIAGYDYHFLVCDFEGAFNLLNTAFAYSAWRWIKYVEQKTGKPVILYTSPSLYNDYITPSQSLYNIDWNTVALWTAQWFFTPNPDGTPSLPKGRTAGWKLWQYTDKGDGTKYGVARSTACDLDVYNGTPAQMRDWLGIGRPAPDSITQPFSGVKRISGVRHGWKFELFFIDPLKVRYESVCLPVLETVSSVAKRKGAQIAVNGGEWDKIREVKDYTVENGIVCKPRQKAAPSFLVFDGGFLSIDHTVKERVWQALSGLRYLVRMGIVQKYLYDPSDPLYETATATEGHARSIHGLNASGYHMLMQTEGVYPNQGLTLNQCAELMRDQGAVTVFDSGGGGDVTCIMNDQSLIVPENIGQSERFLPNVLLIYAKESNMSYRYTAIALGDGTRLRTDHTVNVGYTASYKKLTIFDGDLVWTAPADGLNVKAGDQWLEVKNIDGVIATGWVAIKHLGLTICSLIDHQPAPTGRATKMTMTLPTGAVIKIEDDKGDIIYELLV
jgi:GH25 family lysozyme M1 (1,4-beta-N-acetylmuramidase)